MRTEALTAAQQRDDAQRELVRLRNANARGTAEEFSRLRAEVSRNAYVPPNSVPSVPYGGESNSLYALDRQQQSVLEQQEEKMRNLRAKVFFD